jgi:predicted nucleic acid-binding protein
VTDLLVADASAVIAHLAVPGGSQDVATAIERSILCAPTHLWIEVVNGLRGLWLGGTLDHGELHELVRVLPRLAIEVVAVEPFALRILALRHNLTAYDAAYVALAEHLGARLLTCDRGIADAPGIRCEVQLLEG